MQRTDRSAKRTPKVDGQTLTVPEGAEEPAVGGTQLPTGTSGDTASRRAMQGTPPTENPGGGGGQDERYLSSCSAIAASAGGQEGALAGATSSQKRGRAQKKRARKVKDKMRQLCVDGAAAPGTAATAEGVEVLADLDRKRTLSSSSSGSGGPASTPWPKLERAARDLAALAWARAQPGKVEVPRTAAANASTNYVDVKSSTMLDARGSAGLLRRDGEGVSKATVVASLGGVGAPPRPPEHPGRKEDGMEGPRVNLVVGGLSSSCGTSSEIAVAGKGGDRPAEVGEEVAQIQMPGPIDVCKRVEKGNTGENQGSGAVELTARETGIEGKPQPVADIAGTCGTALKPANTNHTVTDNPAVVEFDNDAADPPATTVASRHRKTRRGKRAGGAINRRRGAKERAAGCTRRAASEAEAMEAAAGPGGTAVSSSQHDMTIGDECEGDNADKSQLATPSIVVPVVDAVPSSPDLTREVGASKTGVQGGPTEGVDPDRNGGGVAGGGKGGAKGRSHGGGAGGGVGSMIEGTAVDVATPPCNGRLSVVDMPPLELAAARSARGLLAMFSPSAVAVASSGKQAAKLVRESSLPILGTASPSSGGTTRLQLLVRQMGVLESLVGLCAPLPWTPVPLTSASSSSLPTPHRSTILPSAAVSNDILPASGAQSQPVAEGRGEGDVYVCTALSGVGASIATGATIGVSRRKGGDDSPKTRPDIPAPRTPSRSTRNETAGANRGGGVDGGRGREGLTESSMGVLLKALEDAGNRERVLNMDGAAPLVRKCSGTLVRWFKGCCKPQESLPLLHIAPFLYRAR